MRKILSSTLLFLMLAPMFAGILPIVMASNGLEVVCVPWRGDENLPHPTYEGKEITLKGTVRYEGTVNWEWDFGDGFKESGIAVTTNSYPYPISAKHTYIGTVGTVYVAKLTVTANGETKSDTYLVRIEEKTRKVEADVAVDEGLWWLYQQQNRYALDGGYWGWEYRVAHTGAAVQAFENNFHKPFGDPTKDPYVDCVRRGLNYLTSQMYKVDVPADDGDTNGNGFGIACHDPYPYCEMYEIGMAMMAIVSSDTPGRVAVAGTDGVIGRTYQEIVQDMADFCAYAQNGPETGFYEGGWRYYRNYGASDNSVTQWPIMGMETAETKWGIKIADFVKPRLEGWLSRTQSITGGFGYAAPEYWVNIAKTAGTGIPGLLFCGVPETDSRIVNAINFIDTNWYSDNFGNGYAMYAVMKAFEEFLHRESTGSHIWWDEYADYLIPLQYADGHWDTLGYSYSPQLTTAWMVMILTKVVYDIPPRAVAKVNGFDEVGVDEGQVVSFDAFQSREGTYKIVKYEWDFESDGVYDAEGVTASHSYANYGIYTVTLRVTDNRDLVTGGKKPAMSDTDTCIVYVHPPPHPPIADANGPYLGWVGVPVTLDGSGSWDPNEPPFGNDEIISWDWDLDNDGEFDDASGKIVWFTWNEPGTYSIALRVRAKEEPHDCEEPSRTIVKIGNHDPVADINGPYETEPCSTITLDGSGSYDPDMLFGDRIVSYEWDLDNDGEYDDAFIVNPEFHRNTEGVYTVRLRVTDTFGATSTDWTTVTVRRVEEWSFAIITDLHIGFYYTDYDTVGFEDSGPGKDYPITNRLKEIVNWINTNKKAYNIRFVVVLGDIADTGEYSEFLKAREILKTLNDPDGDGNTNDGIPYIPIIGNHEIWPYTEEAVPFFYHLRIKDKVASADLGDIYFNEIFWKQNTENLQKINELFSDFRRQYTDIHILKDTGLAAVLQNYAFTYKRVKFIALDFVERKLDSKSPMLFSETSEWLSENLQNEEQTILLSHHPIYFSKWILMNSFGGFQEKDAETISSIIKGNNRYITNFAGHNHFNLECAADFNTIGIKVVTTEAVCRESTWWVGSGFWTEYLGKTGFNIRVVKMKGDKIENYVFGNINDDTMALSFFSFVTHSPVDMVITDPDGNMITKEIGEVAGMFYFEFDIDGDGDLDDIVSLAGLKLGDYMINIVPEMGASPTDTYTLEFITTDETIVLAENVQISNIPSQPYIFRSTEIIADDVPPETSIYFGTPKFVKGEVTYLTSDTLISLIAEDNVGGSGVALTAYKIYNASYDSGWITYMQPFYLIGLSDGTYYIDFNSTDYAGNVEPTKTATVILDNTGPLISLENPPSSALQDGVTFIASADDACGTRSLNFSIREANGQGIPVGFEDIPATYNPANEKWELSFDTLQLPDGFYIVIVEAEDNLGNAASITVPYSIRNWAVLELLPATPNNKAGRTMPVKFALRVAASVDPNQPFVYNEELTIKIYAADDPSNILQTSTFGDEARDYRINTIAELYITNFQTLKTPKTYTVEIWRENMRIGSFNFKTVK